MEIFGLWGRIQKLKMFPGHGVAPKLKSFNLNLKNNGIVAWATGRVITAGL